MALTYRLYRTERIGTGTLIPSEKEPGVLVVDPFRSALDDYITTDETGQTYWDWIHDARALRYALALCESSKHAVLAADPRIVALSPEGDSLTSIQAWLDAPLSADATLLARLEADGCSTAWITGGTTRRHVLRYLMHTHVICQDARRAKVVDVLTFLAGNLDSRTGDVPLRVRQAVSAWITSKGLTTTQFTNNTTVREVVHYVRENIDWPTLTLGPVEL